MKKLSVFSLVIVLLVSASTSHAVMDGVADNMRDDLGYYYALTGGKFPNGQTVNGNNASGGTLRFLTDDPTDSYLDGTWLKDDWFDENSGLALTMKSNGNTVYDNFNNDAGDFYTTPPGGQASAATPGLYGGYCMSNNYDWVYAGYFKLNETTVIDQISGYFDARSGFNPDSPEIGFRMNIWSNSGPDLLPAVADFTGDVFSSDYTAGSFAWSDSGIDRVFGDDYGNATDDILQLTYSLDTPLVLEAGEYWFSHDAIIVDTVVPAPGALLLAGIGTACVGRIRRRTL